MAIDAFCDAKSKEIAAGNMNENCVVLMGLIFSIAALALYYILRVMMHFSLGWLEPAI